MSSAGTVTVDFAAETAKFTAELKKVRTELAALKGDTASISNTMAGFGNALRGFIGLTAVVTAVRAVVRETAAAEAATAQLNNALETAGANVKAASADFQAYASQLQRTTTFGDEAIMQVETLLLSFKGLSGDTVKQATAAVLDLSTRMGMEAPAAAKLLGKALADPEKGLTALTRAGVVFSDSQKDQIKAMKDSGDLAGAQGKILKELEARFGGAAAAARGTFGGAITGLKNAFGDLLEGKSGMSAATQGINALADTLSSPEIQNGFSTIIAGLAKMVELAAKYAKLVADGARGWQIITTGKGGNEQVDIDNQILALEKEQRSLQNPDGLITFTEVQKTVISDRIKEIAGQIRALKVQWDEAGERARQAAVYGQALKFGPGKGAMDFKTGGTPDDSGATKSPVLGPSFDEVRKAAEADYREKVERATAYENAVVAEAQRGVDERRRILEQETLAYQAAAEARMDLERQAQQYTSQLRASSIDQAIGLLGQLGQKHKAFAIASIVIEKAVAVQRILANNLVAAQLAFASQLIPGNPYSLITAYSAYAAVIAQGRLAAALAVAGGGLQIAGTLSGGGGGGSITAPNNPVFNDRGKNYNQEPGVAPQTSYNINITGVVTEQVLEELWDGLADLANGRDKVMFNVNSRQVQEIREG